MAAYHARMAVRLAQEGRRCAILSGGETTVTLGDSPPGHGGRNTEYLLALAIALDGLGVVRAIACDSDGRDGSGDHAGATIVPQTLARAHDLGIDAAKSLEGHDSAGFFARLGCLVTTGPTHTNVNDFRAILVDPDAMDA